MRAPLRRIALLLGCSAALACAGGDLFDPQAPRSLGGGSTAGTDTTVNGGPPPAPTPPGPLVDPLNVSGIVSGREPGPDTLHLVRVPGAIVTLVRVATASGDTLDPSVVAASTTTDAQGEFRFDDVASAFYRVEARAPAGSAFTDGASAFAPPREASVRVYITLQQR